MSTHCHNDLGLAVANSLAGVAAGARQVECAINGLGERAGNAALEEIVMALRTRSDYFDGVDTDGAHRGAGAHVADGGAAHRLPGAVQQGVIGRNAFAHEAGIHQHGVLEDRETYEIIDASAVGQEAAQIVLGKHSGRHAFADSLEKMGLHVQGDALNQAFTAVQGAGRPQGPDHRGRPRGDRRRGARHRHGAPVHDRRASSCAAAPTPRRARDVVLTDGDGKVEADGEGNGMIDAAFDAIAEATGVAGTVARLQGVVGDRGRRRARRRRGPARVRRVEASGAASPPTWSRPRRARTSTR